MKLGEVVRNDRVQSISTGSISIWIILVSFWMKRLS